MTITRNGTSNTGGGQGASENICPPANAVMPLNTVRQTIVETIEASRLTSMGRKDFSNFMKQRVDYERRLKEHNTQNGTSAPMTGYKCSIDESVLEQFVLLGMVPVANLEDITEEHLRECVQNEAEIISEQYDLHQIERDIRDVKMSSNRSESLKTRVANLSLAYGRKLCNMGYANLVLNRGRLALKHIYRRIVHSQLKNRIHAVMELHTENGFKDDYKKFMRKLLKEAEAIDRIEITSGSCLNKTLQSSDESERSDDDTRQGGKPKTERGARTRNGKRKHSDKATNDGRKGVETSTKKPENSSNTNADGKKAKPQCLNPSCAGFHLVDKCPVSTAEDKKSLKDEYFKSKRGRAVNALADNKKVNSSDPAADINTSLFNVTFCDGKLDIDLLADQGSEADIMPKTILNKMREFTQTGSRILSA